MAEDVPPQDPNEKDPTTKKPDGMDPTNQNPVEGGSQDDAPGKSDRNPPDDIRKDFLDEVSLATSVALAAKKSEYQPALLAAGLEADQVSLLEAIIADARSLISSTTGKKTATKTSTLTESDCREALVVLVGKVRSLAKRKYPRGNPRRKDYHIGDAINKSRAKLEQVAHNVHSHASDDPLLKVPAALLASLKATSDQYTLLKGEHSGKRSAASEERQKLLAKMKQVADARRGVQYVADAAWPAREKVHAPIRREFKLSPDRGQV